MKKHSFKIYSIILSTLVVMGLLTACNTNRESVKNSKPTATEEQTTSKPAAPAEKPTASKEEVRAEEVAKTITIQIGAKTFSATLADNATAKAFVEKLPLTIDMNDYGGFEKVGSLGFSLARNDKSITTALGDLVLYNGNQLVIFYSSNTWSYTRLGRIDDINGFADALGNGTVQVAISL